MTWPCPFFIHDCIPDGTGAAGCTLALDASNTVPEGFFFERPAWLGVIRENWTDETEAEIAVLVCCSCVQ